MLEFDTTSVHNTTIWPSIIPSKIKEVSKCEMLSEDCHHHRHIYLDVLDTSLVKLCAALQPRNIT